ncbi:MAG: hypothetical protein ABI835_03305 [Chloroflexota bacterium]
MISFDPVQASIGVIALVLTLLLYRRQRKLKLLTFEPVTISKLASIDSTIAGKLDIRYEGAPITDMYEMQINFRNAGTIPIEKQDFEKPIHITFKSKGSSIENMYAILEARIIEKSPSNLGVDAKIDGKSIVLEPALMNSGDFFIIRALIEGVIEQAHIDTRISGVKEIKQVTSNKKMWMRDFLDNSEVQLILGIGVGTYITQLILRYWLPSEIVNITYGLFYVMPLLIYTIVSLMFAFLKLWWVTRKIKILNRK